MVEPLAVGMHGVNKARVRAEMLPSSSAQVPSGW